ncbi:hypothetical protein EDM68_01455 [Candidatus Uhrbacteria bacterium]|nr:MAG: hypothetical protein EDM68_01455 [Candidatus Uhrbacteria bacterium]
MAEGSDAPRLPLRVFLQNARTLAATSISPPLLGWLDEELRPATRLEQRLTVSLTADQAAFLDAFLGAPSGTLMAYYQWFWPRVLAEAAPLDAVEAVRDACAMGTAVLRDSSLPEPDGLEPDFRKRLDNRKHFLRALPAMTALHALPYAEETDRWELASVVLGTVADALREHPNREVLEIVWQNATTALVANERAWRDFPSSHVVAAAEDTITAFLDGRPDDTVLLSAASIALQFLYTAAAAAEHADDSAHMQTIQVALERLHRRRSVHHAWLRPVTQYLRPGSPSRAHVLPQQSELLMGDPTPWHDAWQVVAYLRLRAIYTNHLVASRVIVSPFMQDVERAKILPSSTSKWMRLHAFTPTRWRELRDAISRLGLPDDPALVEYLDSHFFVDQDNSASVQLLLEERANVELAQYIPFRQLTESEVSRRIRPDTGALIAEIARDGFRDIRRDAAEHAAHLAARVTGRPEPLRHWREHGEELLDVHEAQISDISKEVRDAARHATYSLVAVPSALHSTGVRNRVGHTPSERPSTRSGRESHDMADMEEVDVSSGTAQGRPDAVQSAARSTSTGARGEGMDREISKYDAFERRLSSQAKELQYLARRSFYGAQFLRLFPEAEWASIAEGLKRDPEARRFGTTASPRIMDAAERIVVDFLRSEEHLEVFRLYRRPRQDV